MVGGPQYVVDLGHLVQFIGAGEERVQTERGGLEELTAATKLFTQFSVLTSVNGCCRGRWDELTQNGEGQMLP